MNSDGEKKYRILDTVNSPDDLKKINVKDLSELSEEIREFLIWNISRTGGHLGSNLGIVELTVALHYIFDSPNDKIIWDVGHQSYTHKILTGRKSRFGELRKLNGLSGFTKSSESEHDPFGAGHSSTALSAAIGTAYANMLKNNKKYAIAVIGDGSFTGGMVYEALNNSKDCKNLIVILNDNEMSISKNVGTIADYLANIRTTKKYYDFRNTIKNFLSSIPLIGKIFVKISQKILRSFRRSLYNATFFEQVGFDFLGPVDGHNINKLLAVLNEAKTRENPVFIHVKTQKGRGYKKAESNSVEYHSVGIFDIDEGIEITNGETEKDKIYSFSSNFGYKICEAAEKNEKICAITAAMAEGTGLALFREKYPERFFDVGIAEEHAAVFAAGLAAGGYIPVFAVYSTFLQRSYDQILHDIALQNLHVIFCIDRAGLVGEDGITHHGIFDVAFLNHIPNITVFSPSSYEEFNRSFDYAVNGINSPVVIRYPKGRENVGRGLAPAELQSLDYIYIKNQNRTKYLIISYGRISNAAFELYEKLENAGFIKLNKIKPADYILPEIIKSNAENIIMIEEGIETGGVFEILSSRLIKAGINKKIKIFAINDFVEQGSVEELFDFCGLTSEKIYNNIINGENL